MSQFVSGVAWAKYRIPGVILAVWALFALAVHRAIGALNLIIVPVLGFPLGFYLAAQGALIAFVLLLAWFTRREGAEAGGRKAEA